MNTKDKMGVLNEKVKSYLKHSKQRRVSKDIEFLEKKSNGKEDKTYIRYMLLSTIPLISIYITYF